MADFYQTGIITTLHHLGTDDVPKLEKELVEDAEFDPVALVIPSLASEMDGPALPAIVKELAGVPWRRRARVSRMGSSGACGRRTCAPLKTRWQIAAAEVLEDPLGTPLIPTWPRVDSAIPTFLDELFEAVDLDNA